MPHCMIPECSNHSRTEEKNISFHRVPADEKLRKTWLDVIPRKNPRPALYSYVCSAHFSDDCFEVSFMKQLTGHKQPRRLKPGSIPSIFPRSSSIKPRLSSEARRSKREKQEMMTSLMSTVKGQTVQTEIADVSTTTAEAVCEEESTVYPEHMDSSSCNADAVIDNSVGVQCNINVKCFASQAVQTTESALNISRPVMVDQWVQTDNQMPLQQDKSSVLSSPVKSNLPHQPIFVSPCKSSVSSSSTNYFLEADDEDFECETDSSDDSECDDAQQDFQSKLVKGKKYIVFESQLDKLFHFCPQCNSLLCDVTKRTTGTMITVRYSCINGHDSYWNSQPLINQTPAGNLLTSAAILFSGNSFSRINDFFSILHLQFISKTKFYEFQKRDLWPVINKTWHTEQEQIIEDMREENYLDLCGDGRCDSPGHSAKFGTYTLMEEITGKIVNFQIVQVNETTSSNAMEAEGCKRGLDFLISEDVPIRCLSTDRHITITSNMKKLYPNIKHQYDTWHLAKWVVKKLTAKAKKKNCDSLFQWIQSVSNHLWWSVSTCDGNYVLLKEKWLSIVHHIANKHTWGGCQQFKSCAHHKLSRQEQEAVPWLKMGSAAHDALKEVVMKKKLLKDLALLTEFHHTGKLEVYHSLMLKYTPKRQQFSYEGMVARTQLAALDHNFNIGRIQAVASAGIHAGEKMFKVVFPKGRKTWVAKPVLQKKSHAYIFDMLFDLVRLSLKGERVASVLLPNNFCRSIAPEARPDKALVVERHVSRFHI